MLRGITIFLVQCLSAINYQYALNTDDYKTYRKDPMRPRYLVISLLLCLLPIAVVADMCRPTPHRTTGTHYAPVTVHKVNIGRGVKVRGRILSAPNCDPVVNARIAHWQADKKGKYVDRLRAYLFSGSDGYFEFETEWPNISPPHIHFIVTAEGYEVLETQWQGDEPKSLIEFDMILQQ